MPGGDPTPQPKACAERLRFGLPLWDADHVRSFLLCRQQVNSAIAAMSSGSEDQVGGKPDRGIWGVSQTLSYRWSLKGKPLKSRVAGS
jgi:hypothetical protein